MTYLCCAPMALTKRGTFVCPTGCAIMVGLVRFQLYGSTIDDLLSRCDRLCRVVGIESSGRAPIFEQFHCRPDSDIVSRYCLTLYMPSGFGQHGGRSVRATTRSILDRSDVYLRQF